MLEYLIHCLVTVPPTNYVLKISTKIISKISKCYFGNLKTFEVKTI